MYPDDPGFPAATVFPLRGALPGILPHLPARDAGGPRNEGPGHLGGIRGQRAGLEGGCAFRVLQAATRLRERGHGAADEAYRVARELAPYELLPSPTWEVMCTELEWPV